MEPEPHEGLYRAHAEHTASVVRTQADVVLVHDTNTFELGQWYDYATQKTEPAITFTAHFSLALGSAPDRVALGVLELEEIEPAASTRKQTSTKTKQTSTKTKQSSKEPQSEKAPPVEPRWVRSVRECEARLGRDVRAVHVMDCEADSYAVYAGLLSTSARFVVRADVRMRPDLRDTRLSALAGADAVEADREVPLSRRKGSTSAPKSERGHRDARVARLVSSRCSVTLRRPNNVSDPVPRELTLSALRVSEQEPPPGQPGVSWLLITNEPIETVEDVMRVVDAYRSRPVIEDFFRALKTGCVSAHERLEERAEILYALVRCFSTACTLLELRTRSRTTPDAPAGLLVSELQLNLLSHLRQPELGARPTLRQFVRALAGLGGHIGKNGEPGWKSLGEGWQRLQAAVEGWEIFQKPRAQS